MRDQKNIQQRENLLSADFYKQTHPVKDVYRAAEERLERAYHERKEQLMRDSGGD